MCECQMIKSDLNLVPYKHAHQSDHIIKCSCKRYDRINQSKGFYSEGGKIFPCNQGYPVISLDSRLYKNMMDI